MWYGQTGIHSAKRNELIHSNCVNLKIILLGKKKKKDMGTTVIVPYTEN